MNVTVAAIVAALVGLNAVTILASVVKRQHRTVDRLTDALADLNDDAVELNRRNEWQAAEIMRLRAFLPPRRPGGPVTSGSPVQLHPGEQPTQVMQVPQPPAPDASHRYNRSAT